MGPVPFTKNREKEGISWCVDHALLVALATALFVALSSLPVGLQQKVGATRWASVIILLLAAACVAASVALRWKKARASRFVGLIGFALLIAATSMIWLVVQILAVAWLAWPIILWRRNVRGERYARLVGLGFLMVAPALLFQLAVVLMATIGSFH
jgi:hypothetical protein